MKDHSACKYFAHMFLYKLESKEIKPVLPSQKLPKFHIRVNDKCVIFGTMLPSLLTNYLLQNGVKVAFSAFSSS